MFRCIPPHLRDNAILFTKNFLNRLCIYNLTEKPIFLFATRRGGSTLLLEMLYSQPHLDYVDQPLDLWGYHPHWKRLPHPFMSQYITLSEDEEQLLRSYFQDLLEGHIRIRNQWRIWDSNFSFQVNRLVVKILNAHSLIDWFDDNFDIEVIYLLRHPVPTAMSIMKMQWGNEAESYLANENFVSNFLDRHTYQQAYKIFHEGTSLQKYVLEWILRNLHPLKLIQKRQWLTVTYEEVVARPREISELICSRFRLPDPERMCDVVQRPSRTTSKESQSQIIREGARARVTNWMKIITPEEMNNVQAVLDIFGITVYEAFSPWPQPTMCHFGDLGGIA